MIEIQSAAQLAALLQKHQVLIVDLYRPGCPNCESNGRFLQVMEGKYPSIKFVKVNVNTTSSVILNWARRFGYKGPIPVVLMFKRDRFVNKYVGDLTLKNRTTFQDRTLPYLQTM